MQIELIQQHSPGPSPYRDVYAGRPGRGSHHICALVDDFDSEVRRVARENNPLIAEGTLRSTRFAYLDARSTLGAMLEFAERKPVLEERFKRVADAAVDWDGKNPIRTFG
jgi:hypothetical protein